MTRRRHPTRVPALASVLLVLLAWAAVAGEAQAVRVRLDVVNPAAPTVRLLQPAPGSRVSPGTPVTVRATASGHDVLGIVVDGATVAETTDDAITTVVTPRWEGDMAIVARARRAGAPEALADVRVAVVATPAQAANPDTPPDTAGAPPSGGNGGGTGGGGGGGVPMPAAPGAPAPSPAAGPPPAPGGAAPRTPAFRPEAAPAPRPAATRRTGSAAAAGARSRARSWADLPTIDKVALVASFPLILLLGAAAYLLCQRLLDGGAGMAWKGRGRPDDTLLEF